MRSDAISWPPPDFSLGPVSTYARGTPASTFIMTRRAAGSAWIANSPVGGRRIVSDQTPDKADLAGQATYLARLRAARRMSGAGRRGCAAESDTRRVGAYVRAQADGMLASILLVGMARGSDTPPLQPSPRPGSARSTVNRSARTRICGHRRVPEANRIVTDIATDPRWVNYRDAALAVGLRACWSVPIMALRTSVLGTSPCLLRPRRPTARLLDLAAHASPWRPLRFSTTALRRRSSRMRPAPV